MRHLYAVVALATSLLSVQSLAGERELGSVADQMKLTVDEDQQCQELMDVKATARNAVFFDQGADRLQNSISQVAGVIFTWECPKATMINITGITDGTVVFLAEAKKEKNWALESLPSPLERLNILFTAATPSFYMLGLAQQQLAQFNNVTGIESTFQYEVFSDTLKRLAAVADQDAENFRAYLQSPDRDLGSFENAETHFLAILDAIKSAAPAFHAAHASVYQTEIAQLRTQYWTARLASFRASSGSDIIKTIKAAHNAAQTSDGFGSFADESLSQSLITELEVHTDIETHWIVDDLAEATETLNSLSGIGTLSRFPRTSAAIETVSADMRAAITHHRELQLTEVEDAIASAGESVLDLSNIMEVGFALADEYSAAGFADDAEAIRAETVKQIDNVLMAGLAEYRNDVSELEITIESAQALQAHIAEFNDLSADFPQLKDYAAIASDKLAEGRSALCRQLVVTSGADESAQSLPVYDGSEIDTFAGLLCSLFDNGFIAEGFERIGSEQFELTVPDAEGIEVRYRMLLTDVDGSAAYVGMHAEAAGVPSPDEWRTIIDPMVRPTPSGEPDNDGVRECDRLAADPEDPRKLASGVDFNDPDFDILDIERAIDACIAAVENDPSDSRQHYQLGRLMWVANESETAREYVGLAHEAGYPAATYLAAEMMLMESEDQNTFVDALDMFEKSGAAGYAPGTAMVRELNPDGIDFYKEIPAPTPQEILQSLPNRRMAFRVMMFSQVMEITEVRIKDCFQTSATDFACEYQTRLNCRTSGGGQTGAFLNLMSKMACAPSDETTFGNFRKSGSGSWSKIGG